MRTNDAQMLVLSALADGPLHGYAVNSAVERMTGARLGRGSLSGALARLAAKRLVEYLDNRPGQRQRPLRLTAAGREVLAREARSLARTADAVFEAAVPDRIAYQDRLAATGAARAYKRAALDALAIRPGHTVLDLGCGPGTDLPALADEAGPGGTVLGVDRDPDMAARARTRTALLPSTHVQLADLHALPFPDASVDRAHTDRVLQHVADPARALAEARRVLRPGGLLVMAEPDWETLSIDHPDLDLTRAYTRHLTDRVVRNGAIGRQLPRLAAAAGFTVPAVLPVPTVFRDLRTADQVLGLQRTTERALAAGYFTPRTAAAFLDHLTRAPFFAAVTLHITTAQSPPIP
ncbi:methyltransferase domain-containing protein [Streptomyces sp. NBC_00448]|uniref:methyltransferase domain-containing protein n=1 Tax=Streptomyces sp. NBC_00448 TaxID=2903652 RepID=UPI002E1E1FE1